MSFAFLLVALSIAKARGLQGHLFRDEAGMSFHIWGREGQIIVWR